MKIKPEESNPTNNPNHPLIRCVDGTSTVEGDGPDDGFMVSADDPNAAAPYRVFDILNQENVGPEFATRVEAEEYMTQLGGAFA